LSENRSMLAAVGRAIRSGMPTYAECGGLMYLCQGITDFEGNFSPMVGIIPHYAEMKPKLTLGYRQGIGLEETSLLEKGQIVRGHEFHRSSLTERSRSPIYRLKGLVSGDFVPEGWRGFNVHSSYLHLHFGAARSIPEKFLRQCLAFSEKGAVS
jgi:cobyrinic acid a,c-diamide synthase